MGRGKRNAYRILVGEPEGRSHYEGLDAGARMILSRSMSDYRRGLVGE
jgi:hypothetical protein